METDILHQQQECLVEIFKLKEELSNISDEDLIDEVSDLTMNASFCPVVDADIESYFCHAKLDTEERKRIEACYILYHGQLVVKTDGRVYQLMWH